MKIIIEEERLQMLRDEAEKLDKIIQKSKGTDMRIHAQAGFLIGMIRSTKYINKKYISDTGIEIPF